MPPAKKAKLTGGKTGGNSLQGLTFAITGPLSQTRKHFETLISDNGGTLAGSVTKTVNYLITTEGEIHVNTTKIQEAKVKGLPMLGEEVLTDAIATGAFPDDLSDYLLKGSPPLKAGAPKKAAAAAGPKKTRVAKTLEEADEEEAAKPAKKTAKTSAAKTTTAKASTAKATTAKAAGKLPFQDKVFAISGALSQMTRKEWEQQIVENGGRVAASVTKAVQYLITTEEEIALNPIKVQEAKARALPMLSEDFLADTIESGVFPKSLDSYTLPKAAGSAPAKKSAKKAAPAPEEEEEEVAADEEEEEEAPKPKRGAAKASAAAKTTTAKATSSRAKKAAAAMDVDEEEEEEEAPKSRSTKTTTAKASAGSSRSAKSTTASATTASATTASTTTASEPSLARAATTLDMSEKNSEVVFSFDTTGSMYPCLTQVRRKIQECVSRLFKEIGTSKLRIGITAHGDYCDATYSYVTKHLPLTSDEKKITNFVETVGATGGGDAPECYELVLHEALTYNWTPGWNHVLVLIGDELPHEANANPGKLDWKEECKKLKAAGVQVHGVQALGRKHATKFYATIANLTGGVHLPLDQFSAITDLVVAVCFREARPADLEKFENEVRAGGRYNRSIQIMFDRMLGREAKAGEAPGDMNAVTAGRFQVLDVDHDCSIKDFVLAQGVNFKTGRGFYEFTKPEVIQDYKEIILMDPSSGDMFEGDYARTLINAPKGSGKARIAPGEIDFIPFIQSTSHNRKLIGGTRFLYEIEEGF